MRLTFGILLWPFLVMVCPVAGDDIDAYLPVVEGSGVYLEILLDLGDADRDAALCQFGSDCAPPFMSELAHRHLQGMYAPGEKVTAVGIFKAVLSAVLEDTRFDSFYISLMISNRQDGSAPDPGQRNGGGTILQGYRRLGDSREDFTATLKSIPVLSGANAHPFQPMESTFEWLRYLRGADIAQGTSTAGNYGMQGPGPDYDVKILAGPDYISPFANGNTCPSLYSLLFAAGAPAYDDDLDAAILSSIPLGATANFTQLLEYLEGESSDLVPHLLAPAFLKESLVVTTIDQHEGALAGLISGRRGVMYADVPVQLERRLFEALTKMSSLGHGDSAIAYARDTFNPGEALDNIFVPLFQPASNSAWLGNIKKLKLRDVRSAGQQAEASGDGVFDSIVDALGKPAFDSSPDYSGRLRFDALTFWTDPQTLPPGDGLAVPRMADGYIVSRGGAGQKIDGFVPYATSDIAAVGYTIGDSNADAAANGFSSRQLFFISSAGSQMAPFDANEATVDALRPSVDPDGELTTEQMLNLIQWARGQDLSAPDKAARPWLLGGILHSQPYAINYGATRGYTKDNPNISLLFGSTDGLFHIVENTDTKGNESGRELFGVYPPESLGMLKRRHDSSIEPGGIQYGVDGAPSVLRVDRNNDGTIDYRAGDEAYVYFGLRRGGAAYYALDISNPSGVPALVWRIGRTVGGSFDELGLTFSTPVVGKINFSGAPLDVVIFAGGYNGGWSADNTYRLGKDAGAADDSIGNALYIVDARTGELVWKAMQGTTGRSSNTHYEHAGLVDSIPSSVVAMPGPAGIIDRLYVGDTGGALWRVDLPENAAGTADHRSKHWFITKLADLGSDPLEPGGSAAADRRFFHRPDIVQSADNLGDFDGVLIQSGDRAHPSERQVENYLFYIKDRQTVSGSAAVRAENDVSHPPGRYLLTDVGDQTLCAASGEGAADAPGAESCSAGKLDSGWKIAYVRAGEKGLSAPLVDGGRVFASTYTPGDRTACPVVQGQGGMYIVRLEDGVAVKDNRRYFELGPGIPSGATPVGDAIFLPGAGVDLYDLDGDGVGDLSKLLPSHATKITSIYWREPGMDPL